MLYYIDYIVSLLPDTLRIGVTFHSIDTQMKLTISFVVLYRLYFAPSARSITLLMSTLDMLIPSPHPHIVRPNLVDRNAP